MPSKAKPVPFDGETHWISVARVAQLLGTTKPKIQARALAGEFRFKDDRYGQPNLIAEVDIAPLRAAKLAAGSAKPVSKPRTKSPRQQEAEWANMSARNASERRTGGMFQEHHLRMTLPNEKTRNVDPKAKKDSDNI